MSEDNNSLSSRVFHTIREDILAGKYHTNEELKEKTIGEELGVSRTPVREALRQLELEGLVTIIPNKNITGEKKKKTSGNNPNHNVKTLIFSRENMCSHTVLAKLLPSLFLFFFVLPPTHPISLSLLYISISFILLS